MDIVEMKRHVKDKARQAYDMKLFAGTSGNLSLYDRINDVMVITPTSLAYEKMTAGDMVVMSPDGKKIEGMFEPSSEWRLHASIYKALPEINAVVHTHSPYATGFAAAGKRIPCALAEMAMFLGGDVSVAAFALPGTEDVGRNAVKALTDRYGCLLANHGVVAIGGDLDQALLRAVYIEDAAKIINHAMAVGKVVEISQDDIAALASKP